MRRAPVAALVAVATLGAPALGVAASAGEQGRLDAATEAFNERMTAAGWESQGPADDGDVADDEPSEGDDVFAECLGEPVLFLFESFDGDEFPGQIAASSSDEFTFTPNADATTTTDAFSFDVSEETAAAFTVTVGDANVATVTEFIEVIGAKDTGDCIRQALEAEMAEPSEGAELPMQFDIQVTNESDLGIGDHSAALGYALSTDFIVPITVDIEVVLAQSGNDLVGIAHAVSGEPVSGFDPRAELETIVDALAG